MFKACSGAAGTKTLYPNFLELYKYYPCGEPTVCDFAGIEPELLRAVLEDGEPLRSEEIARLARLYGCPMGLILHPRTVMLDMGRRRHRRLVGEIDGLYIQLRRMADEEGNQKAGEAYREIYWMQQRFLDHARRGTLSYGHYLGLKERLSMAARHAAPEPKRRGLERRA